MTLDPDAHRLTVRGQEVTVPLKEFEVLHLLLANAGRVLTREVLIDRVWGSDYVGDTKTLDVHIKRLRSKIEVDPSAPTRIVTIRGLGYKYERVPAVVEHLITAREGRSTIPAWLLDHDRSSSSSPSRMRR